MFAAPACMCVGYHVPALHEREGCTAALLTLNADEFDVLNGGQSGCDGR